MIYPFSKPPRPKVDLGEFNFLLNEKHPRILLEAIKLYGVVEGKDSRDNPVILSWAKEVGGWIGRFYDRDSIPWCGLFMAVICKRAGLAYNQKALSALSWSGWGNPSATPMLADVLTFTRKGGGHVGLYVGEDKKHFFVLGGNQSDKVSIMRISKTRLYEARRTPWRFAEPRNIRRIWFNGGGIKESYNEA